MEDFIVFPELATEIRLQIWSLVIPEARIIDVMWNESSDKYYTDTEQPAMLWTCNESRQEALKVYEGLEIKMQPTPSEAGSETEKEKCEKVSAPFGTYIDWNRDTIYLSTTRMDEKRCYPHFMTSLAGNETARSKLQDLTLNQQMHFTIFVSADFTESLSYLKKLRTISFRTNVAPTDTNIPRERCLKEAL